jgi:hypothetical protein
MLQNKICQYQGATLAISSKNKKTQNINPNIDKVIAIISIILI